MKQENDLLLKQKQVKALNCYEQNTIKWETVGMDISLFWVFFWVLQGPILVISFINFFSCHLPLNQNGARKPKWCVNINSKKQQRQNPMAGSPNISPCAVDSQSPFIGNAVIVLATFFQVVPESNCVPAHSSLSLGKCMNWGFWLTNTCIWLVKK